MKYICYCFFIILLLHSSRLSAQGQITSASLTANGLTCSMCSKAIYKALLKVSCIQKVQVNIQNSSFQIVFADKAMIDLNALKKAVENAGFTIASLQLKVIFDHVAIANDVQVVLQGVHLQFWNVKEQTLNGETTLIMADRYYLPANVPIKNSRVKPATNEKIETIPVYHVTL